MSEAKYAFFIGDVALDEYYSADYFPKLKEKIIVHHLPVQMGGMIANAACVFASYKQPAKFLAALNEGEISQKLCADLGKAGLDTSHMAWDNSLPDSKTIIILAEGEHTVFIPTMDLQRFEISEDTLNAIYSADNIYSTFCELLPMRHHGLTAPDILKNAKKHGCKIWCDLDVADISGDSLPLFECVDTLFMNEIGYDNLKKLFQVEQPENILFEKGVRMIIITYAEKGCRVLTGSEDYSVEGIRVNVVDVTGAGDTFCSSFMYAYVKTHDLKLSAQFANFAGARAVTEMGARSGACGLDSVLEFIQQYDSGYSRFNILRQ